MQVVARLSLTASLYFVFYFVKFAVRLSLVCVFVAVSKR